MFLENLKFPLNEDFFSYKDKEITKISSKDNKILDLSKKMNNISSQIYLFIENSKINKLILPEEKNIFVYCSNSQINEIIQEKTLNTFKLINDNTGSIKKISIGIDNFLENEKNKFLCLISNKNEKETTKLNLISHKKGKHKKTFVIETEGINEITLPKDIYLKYFIQNFSNNKVMIKNLNLFFFLIKKYDFDFLSSSKSILEEPFLVNLDIKNLNIISNINEYFSLFLESSDIYEDDNIHLNIFRSNIDNFKIFSDTETFINLNIKKSVIKNLSEIKNTKIISLFSEQNQIDKGLELLLDNIVESCSFSFNKSNLKKITLNSEIKFFSFENLKDVNSLNEIEIEDMKNLKYFYVNNSSEKTIKINFLKEKNKIDNLSFFSVKNVLLPEKLDFYFNKTNENNLKIRFSDIKNKILKINLNSNQKEEIEYFYLNSNSNISINNKNVIINQIEMKSPNIIINNNNDIDQSKLVIFNSKNINFNQIGSGKINKILIEYANNISLNNKSSFFLDKKINLFINKSNLIQINNFYLENLEIRNSNDVSTNFPFFVEHFLLKNNENIKNIKCISNIDTKNLLEKEKFFYLVQQMSSILKIKMEYLNNSNFEIRNFTRFIGQILKDNNIYSKGKINAYLLKILDIFKKNNISLSYDFFNPSNNSEIIKE